MNKIKTEAWTHGTDRLISGVGGEGEERGDWMKEDERISQRTCMHDPETHRHRQVWDGQREQGGAAEWR